jgi:hypothetical protein
MISRREAKTFVLELTVRSLRRMATRVTSGDLGPKAGQKDVAKVKQELEGLAVKLEKKLPKTIDAAASDGHLEDTK